MKQFAIICLLLASLYARADLVVVEQTVESRQQPRTITISAKGDKCRVDYGNKRSVICDLATGDSITIDHAAASYTTLSASDAAAMKKAVQQAIGGNAPKPPKLTDTGKKETLDGHDAEIYTAGTSSAYYTFWVTKDYPDFDAISREMKKLQAASAALGVSADLPVDLSGLDGLVLKSQRLSPAGQSLAMVLQSAKIETVPDDEFQPPAGYKNVTLPATPAGQ
jgi:hypothetical protein